MSKPLNASVDQILAEFFFPFGAEIDEPGNYILPTVRELYVTSFGAIVTVEGNVLTDIDIDGPADHNAITVFGKVGDDVINDDGWYNTITIHGSIGGDLEIEATRGGSFSAYSADGVYAYSSSGFRVYLGRAEELDFDRVNDASASIGMLEEGSSNGDTTAIDIGWLQDEFRLDGGEGQSLSVGYAGGAEIKVEDADDFRVDVKSGDVEVAVENSDGIVTTGWGNDELDFYQSNVAYNPGGGRDTIDVDGGNTVGNTRDGEPDTIIFNFEGGGRHDAFVDPHDRVLIELTSGQWSAKQLDAIDGSSGNGVVELNEFELAVHTADVEPFDDFVGKG